MEDEIIARLRACGFKACRNSIIIYKILSGKKDVNNVNELMKTLDEEGYPINKNTIYSILGRLETVGLLNIYRDSNRKILNMETN